MLIPEIPRRRFLWTLRSLPESVQWPLGPARSQNSQLPRPMLENDHQVYCLSHMETQGSLMGLRPAFSNSWRYSAFACSFLAHYFSVWLLLPGVLCKQSTINQVLLSGLALEETQTKTEPDTKSGVMSWKILRALCEFHLLPSYFHKLCVESFRHIP